MKIFAHINFGIKMNYLNRLLTKHSKNLCLCLLSTFITELKNKSLMFLFVRKTGHSQKTVT